MPDTLTAAEKQAADRTAAEIEALRVDSRRRLADEARDLRARKRRRENVIRAYEKQSEKS